MATKEPKPSKVRCRGARFEADLEAGREYVPIAERRERLPRWHCKHCGLPGEPGDDRHPLPTPDPDIVAAAVEEDHRRLGERDALGGEG